MGRIFPLQSFSIPHSVSLGCSSITITNHLWHKKLGHPNSVILKHVKSDNLKNIHEFSSHLALAFDCVSCKLAKSKSLSFPMQGSRASACFKLFIQMFRA